MLYEFISLFYPKLQHKKIFSPNSNILIVNITKLMSKYIQCSQLDRVLMIDFIIIFFYYITSTEFMYASSARIKQNSYNF